MKRVELLTVEHTYQIKPEMLILSPAFPVPGRSWSARTERVGVVRPDGREMEATAQISMTHLNIPDPSVPLEARWRVTMWLTDRTGEEVPVGSRILVSQELRDAILPNNAA